MGSVVEANEIQDADILKVTKIENGNNGMIQFLYPLEDGEILLRSEWLQEGDKRKALLPWMASVRTALVERGQQEESERRQRAKAARAVASPSLLGSDGLNLSSGLLTPGPVLAVIPGSPGFTTDPTAFSKAQYEEARQTVTRLSFEGQRIAKELRAAEQNRDKWETIVKSLGVSIEEDASGGSAESVADVGSSYGGTAA